MTRIVPPFRFVVHVSRRLCPALSCGLFNPPFPSRCELFNPRLRPASACLIPRFCPSAACLTPVSVPLRPV